MIDYTEIYRYLKIYGATCNLTNEETKYVYAIDEASKKYGFKLKFGISQSKNTSFIIKLADGSWLVWKNAKQDKSVINRFDNLDSLTAFLIGMNIDELKIDESGNPLFRTESVLDYIDELLKKDIEKRELLEYIKNLGFMSTKDLESIKTI